MFFHFDDTKLPRLRGAKPSIFDKFKNKKKLVIFAVMFFIAIYIVFSESSKVGEIKTKETSLVDHATYKYNASTVLTMNAVNFFFAASFLPKVQEFQK